MSPGSGRAGAGGAEPADEGREARIAEALAWIVSRLRELDVPFQVVGGLAATAHGAPRELNDIDIYVPEGALERLRPELERHLAGGPRRHRDEHWDCYFMELRYAGEEIELAEAGRTRYRRGVGHPWHAAGVDFGRPVHREVFGVRVPVMAARELVAYKRRLNRPVDREDVRALTG